MSREKLSKIIITEVIKPGDGMKTSKVTVRKKCKYLGVLCNSNMGLYCFSNV